MSDAEAFNAAAANRVSEVQYLINSVAFALQKGLTEVVLNKPQDPIEYLAIWLYTSQGTTRADHEDQLRKEAEMLKESVRMLEDEELELLEAERDGTVAQHAAEEAERLAQQAAAEEQLVEEAAAAEMNDRNAAALVTDLGSDRTHHDQTEAIAADETQATGEHELEPLADGEQPQLTERNENDQEQEQEPDAEAGLPQQDAEREQSDEQQQVTERSDQPADVEALQLTERSDLQLGEQPQFTETDLPTERPEDGQAEVAPEISDQEHHEAPEEHAAHEAAQEEAAEDREADGTHQTVKFNLPPESARSEITEEPPTDRPNEEADAQ